MKSLLHGAAEAVTNALNNLLKITQNIGKAPVQNVVEKDIFEVILEAQDKLMNAYGKPDEMVKQATILGQVSMSQIISFITHNECQKPVKTLSCAHTSTRAITAY